MYVSHQKTVKKKKEKKKWSICFDLIAGQNIMTQYLKTDSQTVPYNSKVSI